MSFAPIKYDENGRLYHGSDANLFVEFYKVRVTQKEAPVDPRNPNDATKEVQVLANNKGEIEYKDVPFIRIHVPGSKTTVVEREVDFKGNGQYPADPQRFPRQWEAFQKGEEQKAHGRLLSEMGMGEKEIRLFGQYNIHTIEHLANVPDSLLPDDILGVRSIRETARRWLENHSEEHNQLAAQAKRIQELEAMVADLVNKNKENPQKGVK